MRTLGQPLYDQPRIHSKQHGGWASQAQRRGEDYIGCCACGIRHNRPQYQAWPEPKPETWVDFAKAFAVWALLIVAFVGLIYAAAGYAS